MSTNNNTKKGNQPQQLPSNEPRSGRRPQNAHKSNSSFPRQTDNPNLAALGRPRSIGLPPKPQLPQGALQPNHIDQYKPTTPTPAFRTFPAESGIQPPSASTNPKYSKSLPRTSSSAAPRYSRVVHQPPPYPHQDALHRADINTAKVLKPDHSFSVPSGTIKADHTIPRKQIAENLAEMWPQKEHEKFREAMMIHLTQAASIEVRFRRKADQVFPAVSTVMVKNGYQRDSDDCYLYWHYHIRHTQPFKYSLEYPDPPAEIKAAQQKTLEDERLKEIIEKAKGELSASESQTPRPARVSRAQAKEAAAKIQFNPYIPDDSLAGGGMVLMVPQEIVGIIVGRGGETASHIGNSVGCYIASGFKGPNGLCRVTISGKSQAVSQAKDRILALFEDFTVPENLVGILVGALGSNFNLLKEQSGCTGIRIANHGEAINGLCSVIFTGSQVEIAHAKRLIMDLVETPATEDVARSKTNPPGSEIVTTTETTNTSPMAADVDSDCEVIKTTPEPREVPRPGQQVPPPSQITPRIPHTSQARADNPPISRPLDSKSWSARLINILHVAVESGRETEKAKRGSHDRLSLRDDQFWVYIARRVTEAGFPKDAVSCRKEWEKTFNSPFGLHVVRVDGPSEEGGLYAKDHTIPGINPRAPVQGPIEPQNGEWSVQEMYEVDDLVMSHKGVTFTKEGPKTKEIHNVGHTWESITKLHNDNGWDRSTCSLAKMWTDVRSRKTPLPLRPAHLISKRTRLVGDEDDNGEVSTNGVKRARRELPPGAGQSPRSEGLRQEHFNDEIRKFQEKIDGIEQKIKMSDEGVGESDAKLAQLELEKQSILIGKMKYANESAGFRAEIDELKGQLKSMQAVMKVFFK